MSRLADRPRPHCPPGSPPLSPDRCRSLLAELHEDWHVKEGLRLVRMFHLPNYAASLAFVNRLAALAEELDHHPDILFSWGCVAVTIWTHSIGGLSELDFFFAARCDELAPGATPAATPA